MTVLGYSTEQVERAREVAKKKIAQKNEYSPGDASYKSALAYYSAKELQSNHPSPKAGTKKTVIENAAFKGVFFMDSPESHKEFKEFAKACKPSLGEVWSLLKSNGDYPEFNSPKQWFDWCWKQPEAKMIHCAFNAPERAAV